MHTSLAFQVEATCPKSAARAGRFQTAHGPVETPIFMPVGTVGSVKAVPQADLEALGAEIILGNNYHLYLRPGLELFRQVGGLHRLMGWQRSILTDSGGYQVFSLAGRRKITEQGVTFKSHIDGSRHLFTPENVVEMQRAIGSDIQMVLDECPPYPSTPQYARDSMELTHRWAARARRAFQNTPREYDYPNHQFGIVQGSTYPELRAVSCETIAGLEFEGNAIGGLSVGEPGPQTYDMALFCTERLPKDKPRYLMGVGTPADLLECIARGVDMFDCVLPSRNARHGKLYFWDGIRNLKAAKFATADEPLDPTSTLEYDTRYSKAYLRHLFAAGEYLANTIATAHNLHFFLRVVKEARRRIQQGTFADWYPGACARLGERH